MNIRVLLADSSHIMRHAIMRLLNDEPTIELVGEAASFAETLDVTPALKPHVLLLDPHMPDESEYSAASVKAKLLVSADCVLAISFWNDAEAEELAETLGAAVLLDKSHLYTQLIPTIKRFYPKVTTRRTVAKLQAVSARP
jgi:two-component system response regulator DevR